MTTEKKKWIRAGLILTVVFQLGVLTWEYLGSVWPLWFGKEVTLRIEPIDPRDMFRGDYVRLNYDISHFERAKVEYGWKRGDVAYISLEKKGVEYVATGMFKDPPPGRLSIRGRVESAYFYNSTMSFQMKYGIEAYFLPREKAQEAEKHQREVRYARVFILPNGRAAIAGFDKY